MRDRIRAWLRAWLQRLASRIRAWRDRVTNHRTWPFLVEMYPLVFGAIATAIGGVFAPDHAPEAFYSAASAVIPVLLLTLAVQLRMFALGARIPGGERLPNPGFARVTRQAYAVVTLAVLVFAELAALDALARGDFKEADADFVYGAIAGGLVVIASVSLRTVPGARE